ncbi:YqcC family protein [Sansalvadorimonas sp. 2012CJ34-2]|uniref:YqcC family protein n=1 Tax=Parendozoicomonas callyspongiae TaxID=2942213 RepID=A0ABT0PK48_9GAMM|nr:YqcC family protein [Sansalvadorimonas sp. 2012CJ34-2]MCL6271755.1 YqcC family protein [Sansalvadorimonas sp. 2012CJ34-2]
MSEPVSETVSALLLELETSLKELGLWSGMPPSVEAMSSQLPFCVDKMDFTEWLQWIYLPRMRAIIDHGSDLPVGSSIHPYAEEALKGMGERITPLLKIVARLDEAMS